TVSPTAAPISTWRRTMLKQVAYITLHVSNQDRALDFYTKVVGFEKRLDVPAPGGGRFVTMGVKGQNFDLVLSPMAPGPSEGTRDVEDCTKAFEELRSRVVKFDPPEVMEFPFGWVARFQDPDGNRLQVRQAKDAAAKR